MGALECIRQVPAFFEQHGGHSAIAGKLLPLSTKEVRCDLKMPLSFSSEAAMDASFGDATGTLLFGAFSGSPSSVSPDCSRLGGTAFHPSWTSGSSSPLADVCNSNKRWQQPAESDAVLKCAGIDSSASSLQAAPDHLVTCPQPTATSCSTVASRNTADYAGYRLSVSGEGISGRQGIMPGAAVHKCATSAVASPAAELSPAVQQLLSALPLEQQRLFSQALVMSGTPQHLLPAASAVGAIDAAADLLQANAAAVSSHSTTHVHGNTACNPGELMTADAINASVYGHHLQQHLQLQAALAAQQKVLAVGRHSAEAAGLSPAGHSLLQLLAAEQQALAHQSVTPDVQLACSHSLDPLSQSLPLGGCSLAHYYQAVSSSPTAAAAAHLWPFPAGLSAPAAAQSAMAAAAAVLQRKQQQDQMASLMQAAMCSPTTATAAAGLPHNQLTASLLSSSQLAAAAAAAASYSGALVPMLNAAAASTPRSRTHERAPGTISQQRSSKLGAAFAAAGGSRKSSPLGKGRNYCSGRPSSSGSSSWLRQSCDAASYGQFLDKSGALNSTPSAGAADTGSRALTAAAFEEYWGADEPAAGPVGSQDVSNMGVYGEACSISSSSNSSEECVGICSRQGSVASAGSPSAHRRPSSTDSEVFIMDLGPTSRDVPACDRLNSLLSADEVVVDAVKGERDQPSAAAVTECKSASTQQARESKQQIDDNQYASTTAGCRVWYPGGSERAGDDSWYLPLPRTCRLFVGNIGCWVDEALLLSYFGKYGKVMDVQVMWNTKMLARGRKVNREFAFISYSTPLEAARAVHWLDGCRLVDVEKDKNGITVEYENGDGEAAPAAARTLSVKLPMA